MLPIINAFLATSQIMALFFGAFYVVYLVALLLLPVERGLSKYVWEHARPPKHASARSSFKEFSQRHHA
jgi:hypothetical protein